MTHLQKETRDMMSSIDDILGETTKFGAKMAFERLFPLHEGDEEVGEKYLMGDYDPTRDHTGQSQISCPYPASHAIGETIEYCDECYQPIQQAGPLKKWRQNDLGEWGFQVIIDGDYISYITKGKSVNHLPFQPYLMSEYDMQEFDDHCEDREYEDEPTPTLLDWLDQNHQRINDTLALEYSLEFFGYKFFRFETDYGQEARALEDV